MRSEERGSASVRKAEICLLKGIIMSSSIREAGSSFFDFKNLAISSALKPFFSLPLSKCDFVPVAKFRSNR